MIWMSPPVVPMTNLVRMPSPVESGRDVRTEPPQRGLTRTSCPPTRSDRAVRPGKWSCLALQRTSTSIKMSMASRAWSQRSSVNLAAVSPLVLREATVMSAGPVCIPWNDRE